jgi:hypothetical protein
MTTRVDCLAVARDLDIPYALPLGNDAERGMKLISVIEDKPPSLSLPSDVG